MVVIFRGQSIVIGAIRLMDGWLSARGQFGAGKLNGHECNATQFGSGCDKCIFEICVYFFFVCCSWLM